MVSYPFKFSRVGGMSFLRICNLQLSWCITNKECRVWRASYLKLALVGAGIGVALALVAQSV